MSQPRDRKLKLLVVDDDPHTRTLLCEALEIRGAEVRVSASAREAAQALAAWRPHLLISDIGMPVEDGYELIRHVRDRAPEAGGRTPAIACTGHARAADRARAMGAGFDAVVEKPVDLELLVETIGHFTDVGGGFGSGGSSAAPADTDDTSSDMCGCATSAPDS
jgi:CheY-like chemotaxis protein